MLYLVLITHFNLPVSLTLTPRLLKHFLKILNMRHGKIKINCYYVGFSFP